MRILLLTQLFQPEPNHLKGLAFARELLRRGHEVEVLTGVPNYPGGKLYPGYRLRLRQTERIDGIPITRVALYPSHDRSGLRRFLSYSSLAVSAICWTAFGARPFDVVHVYQGPATLAAPAMFLRRRLGIPYVLDIQDLWPDSVAASGMLKVPGGLPVLDRWCRWTYRQAARIVVLSQGYRQTLIERGVTDEKIEIVHNWCDERTCGFHSTVDVDGGSVISKDRFTILYAGNLGTVQALESVIQAARIVQDRVPSAEFVFVGDGVEGQKLRQLAARLQTNNVHFLPRQPAETMPDILRAAQVLLLHLRDDPLSRIGIPQKTQTYLAAGRPILAAVSGEAAELVQRAQAGIVAKPENADSIANAIGHLSRLTSSQRMEMGNRGREFYRQHLSFAVGVKRMESVLQSALVGHANQAIRRPAA